MMGLPLMFPEKSMRKRCKTCNVFLTGYTWSEEAREKRDERCIKHSIHKHKIKLANTVKGMR